MSEGTSAVEVRDLRIAYGWGRHSAQILHGINLDVAAGRTLGVVGESGSGKSTLAKALVGTLKPTSGTVRIGGLDIGSISRSERSAMRRKVQMIPQDPYSSLDPRRTIGEALAEAIDPARGDVRRNSDLIVHWLETVKMPANAMSRYPHEFSGGQRQRVAIARGLILRPEVIIADEITSALDVSVQAEILNLISRLREELGLTMVFISHNLAVVRHVSDDVVVLYRGDIVERRPTAELFDSPEHPYTRSLIDAVPGGPRFSIEAR